MRKILITLLLAVSITAHSQYPNPLPSSGAMTMYQVYQWMEDAGEITIPLFPVSLKSMFNLSRLSGGTISLSRWYGYARPGKTYSSSAPINKPISVVDVCNNYTITSNIYIDMSQSIDIGTTVYMDINLTIKAPPNKAFLINMGPVPNPFRMFDLDGNSKISFLSNCP